MVQLSFTMLIGPTDADAVANSLGAVLGHPCLLRTIFPNIKNFYGIAVLQTRKGKGENLGTIFHITPLKCML